MKEKLYKYILENVAEVSEIMLETRASPELVAQNLINDFEEENTIRGEGGDAPFSLEEYMIDKYNSIGWDFIADSLA